MDKTYSMVENTGQMRSETYTFRVCAPKAELRKQYMEEGGPYMPLKKLVSFHEGILAGIPNSFVLAFHSFDVPGIRVYYLQALTESKFGVHVSGMEISMLADGVLCGPKLEMKSGKTALHLMYIHDHTNYYSCSKTLNSYYWRDSVNELKFDITVSQLAELQFRELITTSPAPAAANSKIKSSRLNLSEYYLSTSLSDVSIKCLAETFPAHIFVLSANSEVFEKMFELDMKEAREKSVTIKGSDANVVRELLRYFYREKVENLEYIGLQLYELADKYIVEGLKTICAHYLANHVSIENVLEMYCFGQKHGIQPLRDAAKQCLARNKKSIVKEHADFQAFMSSVPDAFVPDIYYTLMG